MTSLKIDVDCTRTTCGNCIMRPDLDSVAPRCPAFFGTESKLEPVDGGTGYARCKACRRAELEAGPGVLAAWTWAGTAFLFAVFFALKTVWVHSWTSGVSAVILLVAACVCAPWGKKP